MFQVKITNRSYISIGTKQNCVQIGYNTYTNEGTLDWLGTEKGGCEQEDKNIRGDATVSMTDLGFTILRKLYPGIQNWIKLRDSSKFACNLPDGNRVPISNMIYNLLLHGETYYQKRFHAVPLYDEAVPAYTMFYDEWVSNPLPPMFSCHNDDLSDMLTPIYERSNTWREFFQELYKMYDRKTCAVVHSWYLDIYGKLAKVPITTDWKIDLTTRPTIPFEITSKNNSIRPMNIKMGTLCPFLIDSSALRPCESYKLGLFSDYGPSAHNTKMPNLNVHGSNNYTRKTYAYDPYNFSGGYYPSLIKYKNYVRSNGKTRKRPTTHVS